MVAATAMPTLTELSAKIERLTADASQKEVAAQNAKAELAAAYSQAEKLAAEQRAALGVLNPAANAAPTGAAPKHPPTVSGVRPKHPAPQPAAVPQPAAPAAKTATRGPGRPPGRTTKRAAPKRAANAAGGRKYGQGISLPEAVWDALDRPPTAFSQILGDYPTEAVGLKVVELKRVIENEKKWVSSSNNISPMLQQVVADLRMEGKISRNDADHRYFVVDGAELYGPPLDNGAVMAEQPDGTFKKANGETFVDGKGNPVKRRQKKGNRVAA